MKYIYKTKGRLRDLSRSSLDENGLEGEIVNVDKFC